jgi:NACHT domain/Restriction endonuclease
MSDLFHALGYHEVVLNIPKTGRELDLRASHRTGNHRVLAECKATTDKTGGNDINKFVGVLDVERRRTESTTIDGYFISLNGFSPSAVEQEDEAHRIVLLTGEQVATELVAGHVVVSPAAATAAASRCLTQNNSLTLNPELELLAHDSGWYWRVLFSRESSAEAFALVHADGTLLGQVAAEPIIAADHTMGGELHKLALVAADGYHDAEREAAKLALQAYQAFLAHDYGHITVDGLPADEHLGSRSIVLEDLFVPMHLQAIKSRDPRATAPDELQQDMDLDQAIVWNDAILDDSASQREALGNVLRVSHRIAVLGPPGSGKSTLLRRLAVAYGVPPRLTEIDDNLPQRDWIPFVVRCRQLDDLAGQPIHQVLESIPATAEMPQHAIGFRTLMNSALHDGTALILVDGLDEIIDPQLRIAFVKQLRTFVGTYPNVRMIVTSRESGFRLIAGALSDVCTRYRVAGFDDGDIRRLTEAWSALVLGSSLATQREAVMLAETIVTTDRVRRLAQNPLLLTTLLLVRRWVGDLPKKRTALYDKAIEVLLMTWNVEAHSPIDLDVALPQLAYVAFAMTRARSQTLSRKNLIGLLENARKEMPEVLAHTEESPSQFIERIEERSSLLSLGGHTEEEGVVTPLYEFKHLTFQEYLAAIAIVHNYYPGSKPNSTPVSVIKSLLVEPQWLEIIPMSAVLAGRRAATIVEAIIDALGREEDDEYFGEILAMVLARCLADEVLIPPELVEKSADAIARHYPNLSSAPVKHIVESKYGAIFRDAVTRSFFATNEDWNQYGGLLSMVCIHNALVRRDQRNGGEWHILLREILNENDGIEAWGWCCLTAMELAYSSRERMKGIRLEPKILYQIEKLVRPALAMDHPAVRYAAAWAYAWLSVHPLDARRYVGSVAPIVYRLWKNSQSDEMKSMMAWAFASLPLLPASANPLEPLDRDDKKFLIGEARIESQVRDDRRPAALIAGYYQSAPWSQMELREMAEGLSAHWPTRARLLRRLR